MPSAMRLTANKYLVTLSKPELHDPVPMDIERDVIAQRKAQRLYTQPVKLEVLFGLHRTSASLTRRDFYRNGNVLFDLLASLVPFAKWQKVFVMCTEDVWWFDSNRQRTMFDRNSRDTTVTGDPRSSMKLLLEEDMLGILDQEVIDAGSEDRVPDREWTFVIEQVR